MQGAVGPFDRLFEAPRDEMSDSDINVVAKGMPMNGLKRRARSMASIAASGSLRTAWIIPLADQVRAKSNPLSPGTEGPNPALSSEESCERWSPLRPGREQRSRLLAALAGPP
jgi:hypothetical protein